MLTEQQNLGSNQQIWQWKKQEENCIRCFKDFILPLEQAGAENLIKQIGLNRFKPGKEIYTSIKTVYRIIAPLFSLLTTRNFRKQKPSVASKKNA